MFGKLVRVSVRSKNSKSRANLKRRLNLHSGLFSPSLMNTISVGITDMMSSRNWRVFMYFSFRIFSSRTSSPCSRKPTTKTTWLSAHETTTAEDPPRSQTCSGSHKTVHKVECVRSVVQHYPQYCVVILQLVKASPVVHQHSQRLSHFSKKLFFINFNAETKNVQTWLPGKWDCRRRGWIWSITSSSINLWQGPWSTPLFWTKEWIAVIV